MKTNVNDFKTLQDVFSNSNPGVEAEDNCPEPDVLWQAAEGRLALAQRRTVIRHTAHCQDCAESWRVAMRLGARPRVYVRTHISYLFTLGCHLIWQDLRFPANLAGRGARWLKAALSAWRPSLSSAADREGTAGSVWAGFQAKSLAAIATVVAAGGILSIAIFSPVPPNPHRTAAQRAVDAGGVDSLVQAEALPRDRFILRWSGPEGTVYDLRITTEDLSFLDSAHSLTASEYQIPEERLQGLESGSVLLWQVIPLLPDQNRWHLKTFRTRVE